MKHHATACIAAAIGLAACAAQPTGGTVPPSTPPPPSPAVASPQAGLAAESEPIAASGRWDVAQARCREILNASDDDRAAVGMFYYGYAAARLNITVVDTTRIERDLRRVFDICREHPDMTIAAAFRMLGQGRR